MDAIVEDMDSPESASARYECDGDLPARRTGCRCGEDLPGLDIAVGADGLLSEMVLASERRGGSVDAPPVDPVVAMHRIAEIEGDIRLRWNLLIREIADVYASVVTGHSAGEVCPDQHLGERVPDLRTLRATSRRLVAGATDSVWAIAAGPDDCLLDGEPDTGRPDNLARTAGVRMRKIYPYAAMLEEDKLKRVQQVADAGWEVRLSVRLSPALLVIDGRIAVVPAASPGHAEGGAIIRQSTIVSAMMALFAKCWDQSEPMADTQDDILSAAEIAVIKLLATGAKDDAIARQLGTSVRTIRRIIGKLMRRAGVNSRFAFGVWAAYTAVC